MQELHARPNLLRRIAAILLVLSSAPRVGFADEARPIEFSDRLPYGQTPIRYLDNDSDDPVARLSSRLGSRDVKLAFTDDRSGLSAILEALRVPVESQLFVFSKTALNPRLVSPRNPRAIYFNDEVSVAWTPGAASLEISAVDPVKGAVFYTFQLGQSKTESPRFHREQRCLACHAGPSSLQVPGLLLRSFLTDADGEPTEGYSQVTHATSLARRFGGWYVTGTHAPQPHLGNLVGPDEARRHDADPTFGGDVTDLSPRFDTSKHLTPHSDLVAHLVLSHQVHGQNLLIRVGQEHRLGRRSDAEDRLVRYLLFADEAPLAAPVEGTSGYAAWFERQGPADAHSRSLRQFDLRTRLFKHRLSYLVHTPLFDGLPDEVKQRLYRRLWDILAPAQPPDGFQHLEADERRAIIEILGATKTDLPSHWALNPSGNGRALRDPSESP